MKTIYFGTNYSRVEYEVSDLVGETLTAVDGMAKGSEEITFTTASGKVWRMYHESDCCEHVRVEDVNVVGPDDTLVGTPILAATESSNNNHGDEEAADSCQSQTWTFYIISTVKGTVTLRWLGESNGYYSERVDFELTEPSAA